MNTFIDMALAKSISMDPADCGKRVQISAWFSSTTINGVLLTVVHHEQALVMGQEVQFSN